MAGLLERFRPDMRVASVTDIDPVALREEGYVGLLLDLDNTLLPWKTSEVPQSSKDWVERAKRAGLKLCIVSNTHYPTRLTTIARELEIPAVARALKPREHGFHQAAEIIGCNIEMTVVVGDQLLTDILGGNLACAYTILVNPMHPREFVGTKVSRMIERFIFHALEMPARMGTKSQPIKSREKDTK